MSPTPSAVERRLLPVLLLDCLAFGIVLPLLPGMAARFETRAVLIGMAVALDSAIAFLCTPLWGRLSDRIGRRPVLLLSLGGTVAGYVLFALAPSFGVLLLSRLVTGATGATASLAQATLSDVTAPAGRARAMGLVGAAFGTGFTLGPAIGGVSGRISEGLPAWIAVGIVAINLLLALVLLPETRGEAHRDAAPVTQRTGGDVPHAMDADARWRTARAPLLAAAFGTTFAFTVIYALFPLWCQTALGWPRPRVSSTFAVLGLVTIAVQGRLVGRLVPRFGDRRVAAVGALLLAAAFALLPWTAPTLVNDAPWRTAAQVLLLVTVAGAGWSLAGPAIAGAVSRHGIEGGAGARLGLLASAGAMARIAGPPTLGLATEFGGMPLAFAVAAVAAAAGGFALLAAPRALTSAARRCVPTAPP